MNKLIKCNGLIHPSSVNNTYAFTLIEMSIVLVIIGLIVGGILVGQDLINAAAVRSQISQIEKHNTAVHTFQTKYGYLPGDMPDPYATQFGFIARGVGIGRGDGNGVIAGQFAGNTQIGETMVFWVDLSKAGLIDGLFTTADEVSNNNSFALITETTTPSITSYLPAAKIGQGNYFYVWSSNGINYFSIETASIGGDTYPHGLPAMSVKQAYAIDSKIDDGLPATGAVTTSYTWGSGTLQSANAVSGTISTCYDNRGNATLPAQYSTEISGGAGINCALTIQFQ